MDDDPKVPTPPTPEPPQPEPMPPTGDEGEATDDEEAE
jgi:hypothetical protein